MVPFIEIIGLVSNFTGVLLLIRQGVPRKIFANSLPLANDPHELALCSSDRRKMLSFIGMVLFALGTTPQMVSLVLQYR